MSARRAGDEGGAVGSFFVLVGCLVVLGGTFALGVYAGRHWERLPWPKSVATQKAARAPAPQPRAPEPPPLTFYQELTAPLTAPPRPAPTKPLAVARPQSPPAPPASASEEASETPPLSETPEVDGPEAPPRAAETSAPAAGRFTIQVGAYRARPPAESLRATLAAAGHDAYIAEGDGPGGVRYRVRVGAFATREAARALAERLARERSLATYVTTR